MNTVSSLPEHDYVDLGLPSGTLWATENIKDAEGNDLYFAWGETCGYTAEQVKEGKFVWDDYDFAPADWDDETNYGIKKYNKTDGLMILEPKDDAATVNWGEEWKTPTNEQFEELMAYTKYEWVEIDGVSGGKFTSTVEGYTDKFVFFPAVGYADDGEVDYVGQDGNYWSSSMYRFIGIDMGGALWLSKARDGFSILKRAWWGVSPEVTFIFPSFFASFTRVKAPLVEIWAIWRVPLNSASVANSIISLTLSTSLTLGRERLWKGQEVK